MIWVTKQEILLAHTMLINQFGGLDGVFREDALDIALNNPMQCFDGVDFYPTDLEKIAKLSYNIVTLHPFFDGNKRSGASTLLVLTKLNNISLNFTQDQLIDIFMGIASNKISFNKFKDIIAENVKQNSMQM